MALPKTSNILDMIAFPTGAFSGPPEPGNLGYVRPAPDLSSLTEKERPIIARALSTNGPERWKSCAELMAELTKVSLG